MKIFSFLMTVTCSFISFGQVTTTALLDFNNVATQVSDGGIFFNDVAAGLAKYEVPKGLGVSTLYSMSSWFGGEDVNGQLYLAAQAYGVNEDYQPGPLTTDGSATAALPSQWPQTIFAVSKSEIDNHIQNYLNPGYVIPQSLLDWPAHGDVSLGFDFYLAPFVDVNGDGIYNPVDGDYPCIKGDRAVYIIMNDKMIHAASGGDPIGIELHYMFYQYITNDDINNTTFVDLKLINRSTRTLYDFKYSTFADTDIGHYGDDYIGSDSSRHLMYAYNADNFDESGSGSFGYGANPPAFGIMSLSHPLSSALNVTPPSTLSQYWYAMNGLDASGQPFIEPGSNNVVTYLYNGNPEQGAGSTEVLHSNIPGDRRMIMSIDVGQIAPFQEEDFTMALIYNQGSDNINSVGGLINVADNVQSFYNGISVDCFDESTATIDELNHEPLFSISPNPSNGAFKIEFSSINASGNIKVLDMTGREVYASQTSNLQSIEIEILQPAGVYLFVFETTSGIQTERIIIE